MPLSSPMPRKELHRRKIVCEGYVRDDGLWDVEAHLLDTRPYDYNTPWRGQVMAGEPGHEMWLRWTVDHELTIQAIEVVTDFSPYPESCPNAVPSYQRLVGARIGKGFNREVQTRIGRTEGCTHLFTLIHAAANATMQTLAGGKWRDPASEAKPITLFGSVGGRPGLIGSCITYATDSAVVKRIWPDHYTGADQP